MEDIVKQAVTMLSQDSVPFPGPSAAPGISEEKKSPLGGGLSGQDRTSFGRGSKVITGQEI